MSPLLRQVQTQMILESVEQQIEFDELIANALKQGTTLHPRAFVRNVRLDGTWNPFDPQHVQTWIACAIVSEQKK